LIISFFTKALVVPELSAEQLRAKTGKTMRGCAAVGHRKFLHVRGESASGQNNSSPGFDRFAGQRPRAQRSISADLIFGYFVSRQSNSLPAAIERADVFAYKKYFQYPNNLKACRGLLHTSQ